MFAPKVAKSQTKTRKLAPQRWTLTLRLLAQHAGSLPGSERSDQREQNAKGPAQKAPVASWDFSKIPVFSPDQVSRSHTRPPLGAPPLPCALQPKLVVGQINDPLEQEANRVAEQVMRMSDPGLSLSSTAPQINRKCSTCEREDKETQRLRMKPAAASRPQAGEPPGIVHNVLQSPGQPLDVSARAYFELRFGYDFSGVRVHTDGRAAASAASIGASAYTAGSNIAFATGRYDPATSSGRRLLAHELAHVVQQRLAHQNGAFAEPSIIQRDADSEDYRQGYQDGLNGDESHAAPRDGDALIDYDEGYAKGHYEFGQKSSSGSAPGPTTPDSRSLTPTERSIAEFIFGPSLNLDPIVIKESSIGSLGGYVRTLPDTIYVAPGTKDTISTGLLIHELTHCAQYQHGVTKTVTAAHAIWAHYDYGGEKGLLDAIAEKKCFDHFNTEQQADIVRDYYRRVVSGQSTYPWSVFIDQVRAQGACIWPSQPAPVRDKPPSGSATG